MYVLLVYDICDNRVTSVLKICRQYLHRIQNSVMEGEISESNLKALKMKLKKVIVEDEDAILIFKFRSENLFKKEVLGREKLPIENII